MTYYISFLRIDNMTTRVRYNLINARASDRCGVTRSAKNTTLNAEGRRAPFIYLICNLSPTIAQHGLMKFNE